MNNTARVLMDNKSSLESDVAHFDHQPGFTCWELLYYLRKKWLEGFM